MEMCYDGALVMPSSYAVMGEEEMTYIQGGWVKKSYEGANGWAAAAALVACGSAISAFTGMVTTIVWTACIAGGPLTWVCGAMTLPASVSATWLGGQFSGAGFTALEYMKRYGHFTISSTGYVTSPLSVSR